MGEYNLTALEPDAIAKVPSQARAKQRFEAVLAESEKMLLADGIVRFSIPRLASRLGMTRGSVYAYFPTHHAILNELVCRYYAELECVLTEEPQQVLGLSRPALIHSVLAQVGEFLNQRAAAGLLILGGTLADSNYRAQDTLQKRLGALVRALWESQGQGQRIPESPDIFTLSMDIALACFRRSYCEHGHVTARYQEMSIVAVQGVLEGLLD